MKKSEFKSDLEKAKELLNNKNVKEIKEAVSNVYTNEGDYTGLKDIEAVGEFLIELVKNNSNDFTADIATKALDKEFNLSEKQTWCVAYQIVNNLEVYLLAIAEYSVSNVVEESNETEENESVTYEVRTGNSVNNMELHSNIPGKDKVIEDSYIGINEAKDAFKIEVNEVKLQYKKANYECKESDLIRVELLKLTKDEDGGIGSIETLDISDDYYL